MGNNSKIQWTDATWNIARGCTKVDEDCRFCYMFRESLNGTRYEPKQVIKTKTVFDLPLKLKEPSKIFTSSLTDFFHEGCDPFRDQAWDIIRRCPQHTFQILTKRPERIASCLPEDWPSLSLNKNIWIGTSVGSQDALERINSLIGTSLLNYIPVTFLSLEPLYGPIDLTGYYFHGRGFDHLPADSRTKRIELFQWVIVGGESGNENGKYRYRECKIEWIENIIDQCKSAGVPVFVKQLGTHLSKELKLKDRHGGNIDEWPEHLRIRQFPKL